MSTVSFRKDDEDDLHQHPHPHQRRYYHETARREFLYPVIIIISALGYVGYKKFQGEPLTPKSASDAQETYRKMEEDREKRNLKDKEGRDKKENDKKT